MCKLVVLVFCLANNILFNRILTVTVAAVYDMHYFLHYLQQFFRIILCLTKNLTPYYITCNVLMLDI